MFSACPSCGNLNRSVEARCLKCGFQLFPPANIPALSPQPIPVKKKRIWPYILLALIVLGVIGNAVRERESKQSVPDSSVGPAHPITAEALYGAYKDNEVAADNSYKGRILAVTGKIENIGKDITDTPYVSLSTGEEYSITSVQCMFRDGSGLERLRKGQIVTVRGRCEGKFMNVLLKDCSLE